MMRVSSFWVTGHYYHLTEDALVIIDPPERPPIYKRGNKNVEGEKEIYSVDKLFHGPFPFLPGFRHQIPVASVKGRNITG